MPFKANFYDGKSSKTYKATISVNSLNWQITYTDELGKEATTSWNVSEIKKSNVYTKGWISFSYGKSFPFQKIESNQKEFIDYTNNYLHNNLNHKVDVWLHKSVGKSISLLLLTIVGLAIGIYFFVIPAVATSFAANISNNNVISFGNYVFRVLSNDLTIDDKKSKLLQDFVDEVKMNTTFPTKIYVAESKQVNAFALSGGTIVVYSSLLEKIENESQLLALIGHEVSHIENRDVLKNISRDLSGAIFVSILFNDINGVTTVLAENAHVFSQLSFSRELEKKADFYGLEIMKNNDVDLHGMSQLFQILKDETSIDFPTYLSNHPMLEDRILYTKEAADKQKEIKQNNVLKSKWKVLKNNLHNANE